MLSYSLFGEIIFPLFVALSSIFNNEDASFDSKSDVKNQEFYKLTLYMFPENFTSRYPNEANPYRMKILGYLLLNLLVKGYAAERPNEFWSLYNTNDHGRVVIDSVFYEYLTNFTDRKTKDLMFNALEGSTSYPSMSNEDIVVDRIGEYLDILSEANIPSNDSSENLHKTDDSEAASKIRHFRCDVPQIQTSGIPGEDFPNHCHIPETSFSCSGKRVPGIYADLEAGCQVFHVCWLHRIDSFLCPIGTTFNQTLLTCDLWHDSDCSSSLLLLDPNPFITDDITTKLDVSEYDGTCLSLLNKPLRLHAKFLPAKCKVTNLKPSPETTDQVSANLNEKPPKETDKLKGKTEVVYLSVADVLNMLKKVSSDLADELKRMEFEWMPKSSKPAMHKSTVFTKRRGGIDPTSTEQELYPEKLSSMESGFFPTSGTFSAQRKLLERLMDSSKGGVPEIVGKSLGLAGTLLSDDVIPLAKKIIIDSYRKIE